MKLFRLTDIRNVKAFPDTDYRFARAEETDQDVRMTRDYLGENPLHYYIDTQNRELIVGSNIADIRAYLEEKGKPFVWERVRAISNNTEVSIGDPEFFSASPKEDESGPVLQEYPFFHPLNYADLHASGRTIRELLDASVSHRLQNVPDGTIGILLSGGLDSMSIGYLLSREPGRNVSAFTLKVDENEKDVTRSRETAKRFGIPLTEVKVDRQGNVVVISSQSYDPSRHLLHEREIARLDIDEVVAESLRISGNPKKDNAFCSFAMYLIGRAVREYGIGTVFCGEGPNEMLNDYGYIPSRSGYPSEDRGNVEFREALTFGRKKTDRQLGRGGLPKHALARMGKMFAHYSIRLESPFFQRDVARVMTRVPHMTSYDTIKQHLMAEIFSGDGIDDLIRGVSKEKFQDGSGVSRLFEWYDQRRLIELFENIYGIEKTGYLK